MLTEICDVGRFRPFPPRYAAGCFYGSQVRGTRWLWSKGSNREGRERGHAKARPIKRGIFRSCPKSAQRASGASGRRKETTQAPPTAAPPSARGGTPRREVRAGLACLLLRASGWNPDRSPGRPVPLTGTKPELRQLILELRSPDAKLLQPPPRNQSPWGQVTTQVLIQNGFAG